MALPEKGQPDGGMRAREGVSQVRRPSGAAVDDLLVAAGHGDLDAFASFYDHTAATVLGLLRGALGRQPDVAEQAMAQAYLHVWRIAPTFHPSDGPAMALLLASAWRELTARRGDTRPRPASAIHDNGVARPDSRLWPVDAPPHQRACCSSLPDDSSMTDSLRRPTAPAAIVALLCFGLVVAVVSLVGGLAAATSAQQYAAYAQPSWAPPSWLFGPVWAVLYAAIAVSGWLVWRRAGLASPAHVVYGVQLLLNMAWTPLFFGAGLVAFAFAEIVVLWLAIVATIVLFGRIDRLSAWILVPYLAWVSFAAALNLAIWVLN